MTAKTNVPSPEFFEVAEIIMSCSKTQMVYVICKLEIPDILPMHISGIAEKNHVNQDSLYRVMRACVGLNLFTEIDGVFSITSLGSYLKKNSKGSLWSRAILTGEVFYGTWASLANTVRTGLPSFEKVYGVPFFEHIGKNPELADIFNRTMQNKSEMTANMVVSTYVFKNIQSVVDVGGGYGVLLRVLLEKYPHIRGFLFDQPKVIEKVDLSKFRGLYAAVAGDFFNETAIPKGKDLYILQDIIHDWDDDHAVKILRNCGQAAGHKGKILIVENIMPNGGSKLFEHALLDLIMMVNLGGRQRTEDEFHKLAKAAGLKSLVLPVGIELWNKR